ncbi:putative ammonium transporter 1 isoform X2 [Magallana gigas]|uniref:putative ammonium transporter 1 isoform X2 n=1 Tax=Magallana gigas TaxID=29159 RepID=UPI0033417F81
MDSWTEYDWCLFSIATTAVGFLFIQCGLTLLEAGTVRSETTKRIVIRNIVLLVISGAAFWLVGYTFAYSDGGDADKLIGFIQPAVAHWAWHNNGWLFVGERERYYKLNGIGFQDWAGGGVIYVAGGIAALTGAIMVGPRKCRFHNSSGTVVPIRNHSVTVATVGGCFLLLGMLAINGGPRHLLTDIGDVLPKYVINKVISSTGAAFTSLLFYRLFEKSWSLLVFINGAITGMVAISAGCDVYEYYAACIVGILAAVVYRLFSITLVKVLIDDPLDAFAVYVGGGSWGLIALAFFDNSKGIVYAYNIKSAHASHLYI